LIRQPLNLQECSIVIVLPRSLSSFEPFLKNGNTLTGRNFSQDQADRG